MTTSMTSDILLDRLTNYSERCLLLVRSLPKNTSNYEYGKQLIRSSSSPGANYIEALEAFSKKEFVHRLKICRKEIKESNYWLSLISFSNQDNDKISKECEEFIKEGRKLIRIFTASILTAERNQSINKLIK